jgi:hypothetical protein
MAMKRADFGSGDYVLRLRPSRRADTKAMATPRRMRTLAVIRKAAMKLMHLSRSLRNSRQRDVCRTSRATVPMHRANRSRQSR